MTSWKKFFNRRVGIWEEIESWNEKEKDLAYYVYGLLRNIEAIDFAPFVIGLVPLALIFQWIEGGIIPALNVPAGQYEGFWSIGCALLIYAISVIAINKFVVKKLQMKWISELYQKMAADKEVAEAYDKLEKLDHYPDWRIRNTFLRLNKLF